MQRDLLVILIVVIIFVGIMNTELNAQTREVWAPEVAKKLLKSDFNNLCQGSREPVIIYSFQFRELDSKIINTLKSKFSANESNNGFGTWQFITDDATIKVIEENSVNFSLRVKGEYKTEENKQVYNSYLITKGNNSAAVTIEEKLIGTTEVDEDQKKSYIEIITKPHRVEITEQQVFSDIKLRYQAKAGGLASIETTSWISPRAKRPLAIVTYQKQSNILQQRKYFALYVTAKIMSHEQLREISPIISAGNIEGLNQFFSKKSQLFKKCGEFAFYLGDDEAMVELNKRFNNGKKAYINVNKGEDYYYKAGLDWPVFDERFGLDLSTQIVDQIITEKNAVLYLGLSDQVNWNDRLKAKIYYLPASYKLSNKENFSSYIEVILSYYQDKWEVEYRGGYIDNNLIDELNMTYDFSSNWGMRFKWEQKDWKQEVEKEQKILVGLVWNWN